VSALAEAAFQIDTSTVRRIIAPATEAVRSAAIPSAVVAWARSSGTVAMEAIPGPAEKRVREDSIFFLASLTKPIVAVSVLVLVEHGLVDLHAPIQRYVPEFRGPDKAGVTAWHVLTHTSGIEDIDPDVIRRERPSAAAMLAKVCATPLRFEPGTRYEYCSDSFYLLSEMVARLTGLPYPQALRRSLLEPLGMRDTTFDPRHARSRIVGVHGIPIGNRIMRELILRYLAKAALPGGGLWGTAHDLLRFGRSLLPAATGVPRLLARETVELMTREHTQGILEHTPDGTTRDPHYALGWGKPLPSGEVPAAVAPPPTDTPIASTVTVPASPRAFTHGGASGARLWVDPDHDLVFVFLTNLWGVDDGPMFATLREVYRSLDRAAA
jgi:CubicO group peptidase (beta-lactamase class C family)